MVKRKSSTDDYFRRLVTQYEQKVRSTCFRFVNNREDAEDVAQDVFIQVYQSIGHFREESEISTWIYRIAVNKSLDFIRQKKRKKRFARLTSLFRSENDTEELAITDNSNPHGELEDSERRRILNHAMGRLPENQKTAITLSKYEGFSNKKIAAIMDLSVSAVEALMHRAKKNLHSQLYDYFEKHM